jgi:hypothetical protein
VNPESRKRLPTTVEEDVLRCSSLANERPQLVNGPRPQRTTAEFVALSAQNYGRDITAGCSAKVQIADLHMRYLVGTSAGVVEEQKHCVISAALDSATVGHLQQGVQLVLFQVGDQRASGLLQRDRLNLPTPLEMFWTVQTDEACQGTDGRETLISCGDSATTCFFHILKESSRASQRKVSDKKPVDPSVRGAGDVWQKLPQRVPIALLRITSEIPLDDEVFQQESADPRTQ